MSLKQAQLLAKAAGLIQLPAPTVPTGTPEQAANLAAVIEAAAGKAEENKQKKQKENKVSPSDIVNCFPVAGQQGRQPAKVLAKNLSPTLRKMYFSGESRKVAISEQEKTDIIMAAMSAGKLTETLAKVEEWSYNVLPGFVMTGEELAETSPDHVVYLKKGRILELTKAIVEQELHDNGIFDMNEVENPLTA